MTQMIPAWENGALKPVEKLDVHQRGLRHKAVSVFLIDGNKTLIQQRARCKYHTPGLWANACCTHPNWQEKDDTCAKRRLQEELGISGLYPTHQDQVEYRADVGNGLVEHEVVQIYLGQMDSAIPIKPNPDEVMAVKWIDLYELTARITRHPAEFTPWLRIYLTEFRARIFGSCVNP